MNFVWLDGESNSGKAHPNCSCGKKTVYYRAYNGESLCRDCFSSSIFEKTKKTISKYSMLNYGDRVGVAVSGGKDSTSLLYVMGEIMKGHGSKLYAITIDEGIKGYREESVRNAEKIAEKLGIPLLVTSYEDFFGFTLDEALSERKEAESAYRKKITSCAMCGPLRRRSIDMAAQKLGLDVVATAHNLDDVIQTFFINLYSGDLQRIRWLDPSLGNSKSGARSASRFKLRRIKPFMEIYEQELAFFAYINDLPFQSESCPYMNEGIRTEIRENLNTLEARHPGIKYSTLRTILSIASSLRVAGSNSIPSAEASQKRLQGKDSAKSCKVCGAVSSGEICSACKTVELVSNWKVLNNIIEK